MGNCRSSSRKFLVTRLSEYIADAEAYAIFAYLCKVYRETENEQRAPRCVVLSDSQTVLNIIDRVTKGEMRPSDASHVIEAVCHVHHAIVQRGGRVVYVWTPGHRGIAGNEYADAMAKCAVKRGLGQAEDVTARMAAWVTSTPCMLQVLRDDAYCLDMRHVRVLVEAELAKWVTQRMTSGKGSAPVKRTKPVERWVAIVVAVGKGYDRNEDYVKNEARDGECVSGGGDECTSKWKRSRNARIQRQGLTWALREDDARWVEHGRAWELRIKQEQQSRTDGLATRAGTRGCAMGCGVRHNVRHRVLAECKAMQSGRLAYVTKLMQMMEQLEMSIPRQQANNK